MVSILVRKRRMADSPEYVGEAAKGGDSEQKNFLKKMEKMLDILKPVW